MRMLVLLLSLALLVALAGAGYYILDLGPGRGDPVRPVPGGDRRQGHQAILSHGCFACHAITGVGEGAGRVGPKLEEIDQQVYIGGVLPNTPDNMINWIQNPQRFSPGTAMPDMGVSERDARNTAAYLFRNP
jgi:cytochrome c